MNWSQMNQCAESVLRDGDPSSYHIQEKTSNNLHVKKCLHIFVTNSKRTR
jgi:hypothetical protein